MKALYIILFCSVFLVGCNNTIVVMSYNIHSGKGIDGRLDLDRVAAVINKERPDIVGLNEIESFVSRTDCVNQVEYIAEKTNMHYAFGPNLTGDAGCRTAGAFGNAVLSRYRIVKSENHRLYRKADEEQRGCLEAEVDIEGKKIIFLSTHLDCHRQEDIRIKQTADIMNIISPKKEMVIFTGDLNSYIRTDGNDIKTAAGIFEGKLYDTACVSPLQKNIGTLIKGKRIDFIFVNKSLADSIAEYRVINYGDAKVASDHFPILAKISR